MDADKMQLRPAGKGFIIASSDNGLPPMRRLVDAFTGKDNKKYIKLGDEISPLRSSHRFISGN